jgi:glycosyltransferase involved in cell wall biosynthesis
VTDVSVLIPVLDEEAHIEEAVAAMRAQRFTGTIEFLFIDGRSSDATPEILRRLAAADKRIRLLDNPARRTPHGLNVGLRHARGHVVVRMDAHTLYPSDYIARGVQRLARGDVTWVSGPQVAIGRGRWSTRIALALGTRLGVGGAAFRTAQRETEVDTGFTGLWRRETLLRHGGWDEGWPINQDGELAARVRKAGGVIVCLPELAAHYVPRDSLCGLARQYWRYGQYRVKTSARHPESMRRSHVLPPGLVLSVPVAAAPLGQISRVARAGLAAYAAACALTSARVARTSPLAARGDSVAVAVVFVTMHLAWGAGFLVGCARFGAPVRALWRLLR